MDLVRGLMTVVSDDILFPAAQFILVSLTLLALAKDLRRQKHTASGFDATVTRGEKSMAKFYGAYGGLTAVFVTLTVSVDVAENFRTAFVLFDTSAILYVCLLSSWGRDKLIQITNVLPKLEYPELRPGRK